MGSNKYRPTGQNDNSARWLLFGVDRDGALHDINRRAPDKTYIVYNDAVSRRSDDGMPQWRSPAERAAAEKAYQDALLLATRGT